MGHHRLVRFDSKPPAEVHLSDTEAATLTSQLKTISDVYRIESYFDTAISNYIDFESHLASTTVKLAFHNLFHDLQQRQDVQRDFSRSLSNTLTSFREYRDRARVVLADSLLDGSRSIFDSHYNTKKSSSFAFQCIEYMRNIGQHHANPVKTLQYYTKIIYSPSSTRLRECYLEPHIDMRDFVASKRVDPRFKSAIRVYAKQQEHNSDSGQEYRFDIRPLIREYVEEWYDVHNALRAHVCPTFDSHRQQIDAYKQQLDEQQDSPSDAATELATYDDNNTYIADRVPFDIGVSDVTKLLMKRNSSYNGPRNTFISTGCHSRKQLYREDLPQ